MFEVLGLKGLLDQLGWFPQQIHGNQTGFTYDLIGVLLSQVDSGHQEGGYDFLFRILIKLCFPLFWVRDDFNSKKIIWTGRAFIYEHLGADRSWLNMRLK